MPRAWTVEDWITHMDCVPNTLVSSNMKKT